MRDGVARDSNCQTDLMEVDEEFIRLFTSLIPRLLVSQVVRRLKRETTRMMSKKDATVLFKHFWKMKVFWSDDYLLALLGMPAKKSSKNTFRSKDTTTLSHSSHPRASLMSGALYYVIGKSFFRKDNGCSKG